MIFLRMRIKIVNSIYVLFSPDRKKDTATNFLECSQLRFISTSEKFVLDGRSPLFKIEVQLIMLHRVDQRVKRLPAMWETWVRSLGREDPLEKEMETHPSTLAWRIPWTEEPGRLQSMGLQRVGLIILIWYCISYKCTIELFTIFRGYTPFTIFIKYWLYSLHYTIYPCSLFST